MQSKKGARLPRNSRVRDALGKLLIRRGYSPGYAATLIGWRFPETSPFEASSTEEEEVNRLREDVDYRKQELLRWLTALKRELKDDGLKTLIEKEIANVKS